MDVDGLPCGIDTRHSEKSGLIRVETQDAFVILGTELAWTVRAPLPRLGSSSLG